MPTLYFEEREGGTVQVSAKGIKEYGFPVKKIFEELCLRELTTLEGRIDAVRKLYGYKYNVPVYVNEEMLFFKICGNKIHWLNFSQVASIIKTKHGTDFVFKDGTVLNTGANYRTSLRAYEKAATIHHR